jgi:hypothetical protein
MDDAIRIHATGPHPGDSAPVVDALAAIVVPAGAADDPGTIALLAASASATAKHDLRALAQMALYDAEEGTLAAETVAAGARLVVRAAGEDRTVDRGLVIVRDLAGVARVYAVGDVDARTLLAEAYRFTTRWVRLDVR